MSLIIAYSSQVMVTPLVAAVRTPFMRPSVECRSHCSVGGKKAVSV